MVIPVVIRHDVSTNCVFWAPSITGVAVFAVMQPHWLAVNYLDVVYGADANASSASCAVFVCLEAGVSQRYEFAE